MSVESLAIALHHSRSKGTAKLVLLGIANHDGDGGAWPSVATLALYAACDARSVQRAISKLVSLGEIHREVQAGGDHRVPEHRRPNRYRFLLECPPQCDRTRNHRTTRSSAMLDENLNRVTSVSPGDGSVTGGVTPVSPKPSINQTSTTEKRQRLVGTAREGACGHRRVDERHCEFGCLPSAVGVPQ